MVVGGGDVRLDKEARVAVYPVSDVFASAHQLCGRTGEGRAAQRSSKASDQFCHRSGVSVLEIAYRFSRWIELQFSPTCHGSCTKTSRFSGSKISLQI